MIAAIFYAALVTATVTIRVTAQFLTALHPPITTRFLTAFRPSIAARFLTALCPPIAASFGPLIPVGVSAIAITGIGPVAFAHIGPIAVGPVPVPVAALLRDFGPPSKLTTLRFARCLAERFGPLIASIVPVGTPTLFAPILPFFNTLAVLPPVGTLFAAFLSTFGALFTASIIVAFGPAFVSLGPALIAITAVLPCLLAIATITLGTLLLGRCRRGFGLCGQGSQRHRGGQSPQHASLH